MEKKPISRDFGRVTTSIIFDTVIDCIICEKSHENEQGELIHFDSVVFSLKVMPFQTAMSLACEYARSVVLVDYEEGK